MAAESGWRFFIDRGGTFTDVVGLAPDGRCRTLKLLSDNPGQYEDAAIAGMARVLAGARASGAVIDSVRIGTTIGTNALLERTGAPTALVITDGFADLLRIGTQQRPDIFALAIEQPPPLYASVIEAAERIGSDGAVIVPLDEKALQASLVAARQSGIESIAIAFVNAYRNPGHELAAARLARSAGFPHVSVSTAINPTIRLLDRGNTAVVDAYLTPVLEAYKAALVAGLDSRIEPDRLLFMQSHGGLAEASDFRACDSVLSGPAGGIVGMALSARASGFDRVIGFDMGGTSTDVSVYPGAYERSAAASIAGCRIARPTLNINTVAAGGGSILRFSGGRLAVGPESAGASPGPACYRNGGPLTLTDANVLLGRIQPDFFPHVFGPRADQPIDIEAVATGFAGLVRELEAEDGTSLTAAEIAEGCIRIANANMAQAIEQVSVQRGHDVTRFALSSFGGAGGQHACAVADALGIDRILIDPLSGVLSAWGIGVADRRSILVAGLHTALDAASLAVAAAERDRLAAVLRREFDPDALIECRARLRVAGSDTLLDVPLGQDSTVAELTAAFDSSHRRRFGFEPGTALVIQSIEVEGVLPGDLEPRMPRESEAYRDLPAATRRIRFAGRWVDAPVWRRGELAPGATIDGPAMIVEDNATIIVEPAWRASVETDGMLILGRAVPRRAQETISADADPVMLEIFNNQFMHIAEQMGLVLEQTAHSVNIKERLDYSCALFDRDGALIANAPHVPVHLGSMGDSVGEVIRSAGRFRPGDAYMLNAPYRGGTHLPDITVVSPVFEQEGERPGFFVASRAHHADIGGITPGSMPPGSRSIDEEGIVIDCTRIVRDGRLDEAGIVRLLASGPYPARNPSQNLADLKAQLAANATGRRLIERLTETYGSAVIHAYMGHVRHNAERCAREALRRLHAGRFALTMDCGARIAVAIDVDRDGGEARIDFTGTDGINAGNLNAPRSVVRAVVLYVLRTLIRENIPLNAGCLAPIDLVIPRPSLLDPESPAAVAGGNVETSQCIADVLLAALGAAAASQGTMNNLSFGNDRHQYYETICGGTGAGPGFAGASAVHSHMTNSRLTDVEVLEQRYPVRVRRFAIRAGSGGVGRWPGGDGVIRELEFLEPMQVSLLANRRSTAPFGLAGGGDGLPGADDIVRADGSTAPLPPAAIVEVVAGDRIVIRTPGGGAYG